MELRKRTSQILVVIGLCLLIFNMSTISAAATGKLENVQVHSTNFTFTVDSKHYTAPTEQQGFIYQDRTYVPLRFASTMLEKWVDWDKEKKAVVVTEPTKNQLQQLKQKKETYIISIEPKQTATKSNKLVLPVYSNYGSFIVYGQEQVIPLDVTTILHNGTIYVPLRFFGEVLKHSVHFDEQTKAIMINTSKQSQEQQPTLDEPKTEEISEDAEVVTPPAAVTPGAGSVPTVSRESIVANAEAELNRLREVYLAKADALGQQYQLTSEKDKRDALINEGLQTMSEADTKVSETLEKLNQTLEANGYTVGTDSQTFKDLYIEQKNELMDAFLSKLN